MLSGRVLLCLVLVAAFLCTLFYLNFHLIILRRKIEVREGYRLQTEWRRDPRVIGATRPLTQSSVWQKAESASLPLLLTRISSIDDSGDGGEETKVQSSELMRARVREGVPPPLCAGRCAAPPAGPVCAFDATGTARTFATLCELEAVSCHESTYYAITSLGEC